MYLKSLLNVLSKHFYDFSYDSSWRIAWVMNYEWPVVAKTRIGHFLKKSVQVRHPNTREFSAELARTQPSSFTTSPLPFAGVKVCHSVFWLEIWLKTISSESFHFRFWGRRVSYRSFLNNSIKSLQGSIKQAEDRGLLQFARKHFSSHDSKHKVHRVREKP